MPRPKLRHIQPFVLLRRNNQNYDLSPFVQRIIMDKSIDRPVGSCVIVLNPSITEKSHARMTSAQLTNFWKKIIRPMNVISVKIDEKSEDHSFVGLVDSVTESQYRENRGVGNSVTVTLSMLLPKALMKDEIVRAELLWRLGEESKAVGESANLMSWFKYGRGLEDQDGKARSAFVGAPPIDGVNYILDNLPTLFTVISQAKNGGVTENVDLAQFITSKSKKFTFLAYEMLYFPELSVYEGNLLQYLLACVDNPFYEVWFDAEGNDAPYCTITIRSKPYTHSSNDADPDLGCFHWDGLPMVNIDSKEVLQEDLGYNDYEMKNYFEINFQNSLITPPGSALSSFMTRYPIVYVPSITEFGLRPLRATSKMLFDWNEIIDLTTKSYKEEKQITDTDREIMDFQIWKKREKLAEWYAFPFYDSGRITVMGDEDKYKIGNRVFYEDKLASYVIRWSAGHKLQEAKGLEYYIRGLRHYYEFPSTFKTTLNVSHGQPKDMVPDWYNDIKPVHFVGLPRHTLRDEFWKSPVDEKGVRDERDDEKKPKLTVTEEVPIDE